MTRVRITTLFVPGLLALLLGSTTLAHAALFQLAKVLDTDTLVPGEGGITFDDVDEPPGLSDGTVFVPLRFGISSIEAHFTATVGGTPVEIARDDGPMPDGVSTIRRFASRGFDISGSNLSFAPRRDSNGNDTYFATLSGSLQLVAEANVTAIPDVSGDLFTGLANTECCPMSGENYVFEGFGPSDKNGIYTRINGTLQKIAQTGEPSPDGSTYSSAFDEPDIDGQNVVFESRTNAGATQGAFGVVGGTAISVATTNTTVPGQVDTFTFLDNPQISGSTAIFNGNSASVVEGIYRVNLSPSVGTPTKVVQTGDAVPGVSGQVFSDLGDEGISMGGNVIGFEGGFNSGAEDGIFASVAGSLINLVDSTQMLDGKAVSSVDFAGEGIDGIQLAFSVDFDDNSEAVYIATANCPATQIFANQTLSGYVTEQAATSITLGPNMIFDGAEVVMLSPQVIFENGTRISGSFALNNTTVCP